MLKSQRREARKNPKNPSCADGTSKATTARQARSRAGTPDDEEGQYVEGDYGTAGSEGGLPEPLGEKAGEAGRFVKADYAGAGTAPGRTADSEIGQYAEGDYGRDGKVDPLRKARTEAPTEKQ